MTKSPQILRWGNVPAQASGPLSSVPSKVFLKQNFHVMKSFPQTKFHRHTKCSSNEIFMSRKLFLKRNFHVMQSIVGTKFPCDAKNYWNEISMTCKVLLKLNSESMAPESD